MPELTPFTTWTPARTKQFTTAVLVVVNPIPIPLVLTGAWRPGDVLVAYWIENVAVWFWSMVHIATARGGLPKPSVSWLSGDVETAPKPMLVMFFCFHYGFFTVGHGMVTLIVIGMTGGVTGSVASWIPLGVALLISHGVVTAVHWFGRGERDRVSSAEAMFRPYGRIFVLHGSLLGGVFLMTQIDEWLQADDSPASAIGWADISGGAAVVPGIVLVCLKLILDVGTHLARHRDVGRDR